MIHVIIPAAGLGTRMAPLSSGLSKALIPVNGKPIISWIVNELSRYDDQIGSITVVESKLEDISQYFDLIHSNGITSKIRCIQQDPAFGGPLGAIYSAITEIHLGVKDSVLVWLGDTIFVDSEFNFDKESFVVVDKPVKDTERWCVASISYEEPGLIGELFDKVNFEDMYDQNELYYPLIGIYYFKNALNFVDACNFTIENKNGKIGNEYQIAPCINRYAYEERVEVCHAEDRWYDCGELDTYYKSCARLLNLSAREQTLISIDIDKQCIEKESNPMSNNYIINCHKLDAEVSWFNAASGYQQAFVPTVLNHCVDKSIPSPKICSYIMTYEPGKTMSDMWVYEKISASAWKSILTKLINTIQTVFHQNDNESDEIYKNIVKESDRKRYLHDLERRLHQRVLDINAVHVKISDDDLELIKRWIAKTMERLQLTNNVKNVIVQGSCNRLVHGDMHLGNILYDGLSGKITLIDPRDPAGELVDKRYDYAKLMQSLFTGYHSIMDNMYKVENDTIIFDLRTQAIMSESMWVLKQKLSNDEFYACQMLSVLLLLTCIPFHMDNPQRQKAFYMRSIDLMQSNAYMFL